MGLLDTMKYSACQLITAP